MKGQEPAFPITMKGVDANRNHCEFYHKGMTKLFYAACAVMQGIMSNQEYLKILNHLSDKMNKGIDEMIAKSAFEIAQAMLEEEERLTKNG